MNREPTVDEALAALKRYEDFVSRQLQRTHWTANPWSMEPYIAARKDWIDRRRNYLTETYRVAINAAENVIGKQWLFDARPRPREWG